MVDSTLVFALRGPLRIERALTTTATTTSTISNMFDGGRICRAVTEPRSARAIGRGALLLGSLTVMTLMGGMLLARYRGVAARPAVAGARFAVGRVYLAHVTGPDELARLTRPTSFTPDSAFSEAPAFTPDGRAVLFQSARSDGDVAIYQLDLATQRTTRLTQSTELELLPRITPDGLHYSTIRTNVEFYVVNGRRRTRVLDRSIWLHSLRGAAEQSVRRLSQFFLAYEWVDSTTVLAVAAGTPNVLLALNTHTGVVDTLSVGVAETLIRRHWKCDLRDDERFHLFAEGDQMALARGRELGGAARGSDHVRPSPTRWFDRRRRCTPGIMDGISGHLD